MNEEALKTMAKNEIAAAMASIEAFSKTLLEDPRHAMVWSAGAFESAAHHDVYRTVLDLLESGTTRDQLRTHATNYALDGGRRASNHSSSPTSNLMDQHGLAAWAGLAQFLSRV